MNTAYIAAQAMRMQNWIASIKSQSPVFPYILFGSGEGEIWASTLVVFVHDNCKYHRHHVERLTPTPTIGYSQLQWALVNAVEQTLKYGIPSPLDDFICRMPDTSNQMAVTRISGSLGNMSDYGPR